MSFSDLVLRNRSYRRFDASMPVTQETLHELIDLARTVPSTANSQPIRFLPLTDPRDREQVYPALHWAGALPDWDGPIPEERPTAYLLLLTDRTFGAKPVDLGICAQTILLGAVERGLGGCMLMNIDRPALCAAFGIDPARYSPDLVIALGKPVEKVVLTSLPPDGDVRYHRDPDGTHYVPKRALEDLILTPAR